MTDDQTADARGAAAGPETLDELYAAYGDGSFESEEQRQQLAGVALRIARQLDEAEDDLAGNWYWAAAACPRWEDEEWLLCWQNAVLGYALWAHRFSDHELCDAWAFRLVEDAADHGPHDRAYMAGEYKIYRSSWQTTRGAESDRHSILRHLLSEHTLPQWQRVELVRLLSNSRWFGQEDWEGVRSDIDGACTAGRSWDAFAWLLDGLAAPIFRSAGMGEAAASCEQLPSRGSRTRDHLRWVDQVEAIAAVGAERRLKRDRGMEASIGFSRSAKTLIVELLEGVGLGEQRSLFQTTRDSYVEDDLWEPSGRPWRLLRGTRTWLSLYAGAASRGEADEWMSAWADASGVVVLALQRVLEALGDQLGTDWSTPLRRDDPLRARWSRYVDELRPIVAGYLPVDGTGHGPGAGAS